VNYWETEFPLCEIFAEAFIIRVLKSNQLVLKGDFVAEQAAGRYECRGCETSSEARDIWMRAIWIRGRKCEMYLFRLQIHVIISYLEEDRDQIDQRDVIAEAIS
jgi:hypothetical protein